MINTDHIRSVHWQPKLGATGDIVTDTADVEQCLAIIARTPKGSDPLRPEFGCDAWKYLDWPVQLAIPHIVRESLDAWRKWEPRIKIDRVSPGIDESHIKLQVFYQLADGVIRSATVSLPTKGVRE